MRVLRQIALRDVLPVAAVVGEGDRVLVEDLHEALRAAAVLDIGWAVGGRRRKIEAVGVGQARREILVDLGAPAAARFLAGIAIARPLAGLDRLDRRVKATSLE